MLLKNGILFIGQRSYGPTMIGLVDQTNEQKGIYFQQEVSVEDYPETPNSHFFVPYGTEEVMEVPFVSYSDVLFWGQFWDNWVTFQHDSFNRHFSRLTGIKVEGTVPW